MEYETLKATEEEENLKKLNENNINNHKKISIKKKIILKCFFKTFTLLKCFIFFVIFSIFFLIIDYSFSKINTKIIYNIATIINSLNKNINATDNKGEEEYTQKEKDIYKEEKFDNRIQSFKKAKPFLESCLKGEIINKNVNTSETPKVSAVIPVYNSKNIILRAIRSIQNQNLLNLEIILVNDFSTDDTLTVIESFQELDHRIKIIKNKKNMGIIYSRSIGVLSAKGKYIFPLDNDDMFLDKDVFKTITDIADKGNFDIVEFKGIIALLSKSALLNRNIIDTSMSNHKLNLVLFQPELGNFPFKLGNKLGQYDYNSVFLWGKCIKTEIYQKALNLFGEERYSRYMIRHEDVVAISVIFNIAKSYKFVGKYGIYHIHRDDNASRKRIEVEMIKYNIYFLDAAIDFVQEVVENKKLLVYLMVYLLNRPKLKEALDLSDYTKKLFISCIDRVLKQKLISDSYKDEIKKRVKKLNFLEYN
jgi:glycosyltransferase involved in cell wall biosynthesis